MLLLVDPVNAADVVMVVGEGLAVGEAIANIGAKVDGVMDVGATDDGAAVVGAKVDGVMDVGEGLEMVEASIVGAADVDVGVGTGFNVGDVVDGLLTFPPVFVQNVVVPVGS